SLLATLVSGRTWILDGDLGEYDDVGLALRLQAADAVIFLDFPRRIYLWRALRRSRESLEFWKWAWRYRDTSRPRVLAAIASHARRADVHVLLHPRSVGHFVLSLERKDDRDE